MLSFQHYNLESFRDFGAMYKWFESYVLPSVYPYRDYSGNKLDKHQRNFHSNMNAYRIGPAVLRQVRVKKGKYLSLSLSLSLVKSFETQ